MKKNTRQILLIPAFDKFIAVSVSGTRTTISGKKIKIGSISQYRCVCKLLRQYEEKYQLTLRIVLLHRSSLRQLQSEKLYWKRFFRHFSSFLYNEKKFYDQYIGSVAKVLRTFFNYLKTEKTLPVGDYHKQFRVPAAEIQPVVLEPYQLRRLITDQPFHHSLPPHLQRTKDIFVFGATVGLRFSDLMALKKTNIQPSENGSSIILNTKKTAALVKIPLPPYCMQLIEKYKTKAGRYVLPRISSTNLNLQLKTLMEYAGYTNYLPKIRNKKGSPVEIKTKTGKTYRFCDHVGTHTMRRTAITTLLLMGVEETFVRRISGHAPGSKEFFKYVAVVQDYLNTSVREAHQKLLIQSPATTPWNLSS